MTISNLDTRTKTHSAKRTSVAVRKLVLLENQPISDAILNSLSAPGIEAIFPSGIQTERALREQSADFDKKIIEFNAVDSELDSYLRINLSVLCAALARSLAIQGADGGEPVIPPHSAQGLANALSDFLFIELRPLFLAKARMAEGGFNEITVLPRPSGYAPGIRKFFAQVAGVVPEISLSHLAPAVATRVSTPVAHPFALKRQFRSGPAYDLEDSQIVALTGAPIVFTTLANARSAALVMPVIAGLEAKGPVGVFLSAGMDEVKLRRFCDQFGVGPRVTFLFKRIQADASAIGFRSANDVQRIGVALARWADSLKTLSVDAAFTSSLPLILNVTRKRLPPMIDGLWRLHENLGPLLRSAPSVTATPGSTLDATFALATARAAGVRTVEIQRGIIAPTTTTVTPVAEHVLAIDAFSRRVYENQLNVPPEAITVVGSLKLDVDLSAFRTLSSGVARADIPQLTGWQDRRIILLAGQPLGPAIMDPVARVVMQAAAALEHTCVVVKPHPEDGQAAREMYASIAKESGLTGFVIIDDQPVSKLIVAADAVATYFSTVGLEAYALGRDVLAINPFEHRPPYDLADVGAATEFASSRALVDFFTKERPAQSPPTEELALLRDGRTRDRIVAFISTGDAATLPAQAPILTYAALRAAVRSIEVDEGPRAALALLNRENHFPSTLRGVLGVYPNLCEGKIDAAFKGFVHWGLIDKTVPMPDDIAPWDGGHMPDRLVVWAPTGIGIGAEVLHLGFLAALSGWLNRLVLVVDDRLVALMRIAHPELDVRPRGAFSLADLPAAATRHTAIMSLGSLAKQKTGRYRRSPRFLRGSDQATAGVRRELTDGKLVGLAWKTTNAKGAWRNVSRLSALLNSLPTNGVRYVCLQHGVDDAERALLAGFGVLMPAGLDPVGDIDGYVDHVGAMDAVLTTPNSLAHFAGAAGVPVVMLSPNPSVPEWRSADADTRWYSRVTIIRYDATAEDAEEEALARAAIRLAFFIDPHALGASLRGLAGAWKGVAADRLILKEAASEVMANARRRMCRRRFQ